MKAKLCKQLAASLAAALIFTTGFTGTIFAATAAPAAKSVTAALNDMKVSFNNGETKTIQTYMINDYNYVRVREVVAPANYSISPCGAPEVGVMIDSGFPYVDAGQMEPLTVKNPSVTLQTGNVYFNGMPYAASCFLFADRYYFKLADIQAASDATLASQIDAVKRSATVKSVTKPIYTTFKGFTATWDTATNIVHINTPETDLVAIFNAERNGTGTALPTATPTPQPVKDSDVTAQPLLSEPPTVGSTLAKILIDPSLGAYEADGRTPLYSNYTKPYANTTGIGACTWYAHARLWEVTGIDTRTLYSFPEASTTALNNLSTGICEGFTATTDKTKISSRSIAVWPTHDVYIEYVEKDSNGNPTNVYFSDGGYDNGVYKPSGKTGVIQKKAYADFLNYMGSDNELLGYIKVK